MKSIVFEIFEYSVLYIWNYSIGIICIWNRLFSKFSSIRYSVLDFIDFEVLFNEVYVHKNYSIGIIIYSSIRYWLFDFIDFDILFDEVYKIIVFEIFEYSVLALRFPRFRYLLRRYIRIWNYKYYSIWNRLFLKFLSIRYWFLMLALRFLWFRCSFRLNICKWNYSIEIDLEIIYIWNYSINIIVYIKYIYIENIDIIMQICEIDFLVGED